MQRKIIWVPGVVAVAVALLLAGPGAMTFLKRHVVEGYAWEQSAIVDAAERQTYLADHPDVVRVVLLCDCVCDRKIEDDVNASGILGRRKLKIDRFPQGSTLAEQLAVLARVTRDPSYFAVIGPVGSERALHAAEILSLGCVPLLPLSAISPRLSEFPLTLMVHPSVTAEAETLITDFRTNGVTRLAIVNDDSIDWSTRGAVLEDAAMKEEIDVPTHIFFDADDDVSWPRIPADHRAGTTGIALLAPYGIPTTETVAAGIRRRVDRYGPMRILSLPKTDRAADLRRTVWTFAAAFAAAEKSGVPTGISFIRAALLQEIETPEGRLSFGPDRFLAPSCSIVPIVR